jgi:hypothetical protein
MESLEVELYARMLQEAAHKTDELFANCEHIASNGPQLFGFCASTSRIIALRA